MHLVNNEEENEAGLSWCRKVGSFPLIIHRRRDKVSSPYNYTKHDFLKRKINKNSYCLKFCFIGFYTCHCCHKEESTHKRLYFMPRSELLKHINIFHIMVCIFYLFIIDFVPSFINFNVS